MPAPPSSTTAPAPGPDSDSEDDYMKMTFPSPPHPSTTPSSKAETSLQRRLRLQREGAARARAKSKAELAAEAESAREAALRTSLLADPARRARSKGFAMMARMGFSGSGGLGPAAEAGEEEEAGKGTAEPIPIEVKDDRAGVGMESDRKRRAREAGEEAERMVKRAKADEGEYRERVRREREAARLEGLVAAAQKVAERMEEEEGGTATARRPLKAVNVLWRGLVRAREEAERDRRMRRDLERSLSRLPTYEDDDEDEDDRRALGKGRTVYDVAEDLDEEDAELDAFNALEPAERLRRVVEHLRSAHRYCFWCKFTYPDDGMEGCPGLTEEDHD